MIQSWEIYIYKSFVKNPLFLGAPQMRYMPLVLSLNSERLFKSSGFLHYKIPHVTETITSNHALFLIYPTAAHSLWDTRNTFQQVLLLFLLHWAWEDTHKKEKKIKKGARLGTFLAGM